MKKNFLVSLLVCLNMVLLTGMILASYSPPAANAQTVGLAGNYLMVAGEIQDGYDAMYLIDLRNQTLHAFYYDRGPNKLAYGQYRDLRRDFRNEE